MAGIFDWLFKSPQERSGEQLAGMLSEYGFTSPAQRLQTQTNQNLYSQPQMQPQMDPQQAMLQQMQGGMGMQQPQAFQPPSSIVPAATAPTSLPLELQMRMATIPGFENMASGLQAQQAAMERQQQGQQFGLNNMDLYQRESLAQNQKQFETGIPFKLAELDLRENEVLNNLEHQRAMYGLGVGNQEISLKELEQRTENDRQRIALERARLQAENARAGKVELKDQIAQRDCWIGRGAERHHTKSIADLETLQKHPGLSSGSGTGGNLAAKFSSSDAATSDLRTRNIQGATTANCTSQTESGWAPPDPPRTRT